MELLELFRAVQILEGFPRVRPWFVVQPLDEVFEFSLANSRVQNLLDFELFFEILGFCFCVDFGVLGCWFKKGYVENVRSESHGLG